MNRLRHLDGQVVVLGDAMRDQNIYADVNRISPEAPIPIYDAKSMDERPGGAANVEHCINAMACGSIRGLLISNGPRATVKQRVFVGDRMMARIDFNHSYTPDIETLHHSCKLAVSEGPIVGVAIPDYGYGAVNGETIGVLREWFEAPFVLDPKTVVLSDWNGLHVKMNRNECSHYCNLLGIAIKSLDWLDTVWKLTREMGALSAGVTLGDQGLVYCAANCDPQYVAALPMDGQIFDPTGAGDVVTATLAVCLGAGMTLDEAYGVANVAAGLSVRAVGCYQPKIDTVTTLCEQQQLMFTPTSMDVQ